MRVRIASARARAQLEEVDETPEEVHDAVMAILARWSWAARPPRPDPLTGRIVTPTPAAPGPLTAAQHHRRIMEIARLAGRVPPE